MDICLEVFICVSAEQTKFFKKVSKSSDILCQTFAAEAAKRTGDLKSCYSYYAPAPRV